MLTFNEIDDTHIIQFFIPLLISSLYVWGGGGTTSVHWTQVNVELNKFVFFWNGFSEISGNTGNLLTKLGETQD